MKPRELHSVEALRASRQLDLPIEDVPAILARERFPNDPRKQEQEANRLDPCRPDEDRRLR